MLARAMQRVELPWWEAYRYVNAHAEHQETVPDDASPMVKQTTPKWLHLPNPPGDL